MTILRPGSKCGGRSRPAKAHSMLTFATRVRRPSSTTTAAGSTSTTSTPGPGSRPSVGAGSRTEPAGGIGPRPVGPGSPTSPGVGCPTTMAHGTFPSGFGWTWSWGGNWGPAWVNWAWWPGYVGWCPYGYYNNWWWGGGWYGGGHYPGYYPPHRPPYPGGGGGSAQPARRDAVPPRTASGRVTGNVDAAQSRAGSERAVDLSGQVRMASIDRRGWTAVRQEDFASPNLTRLARSGDRVMPTDGDQMGVVMTGPLTTRSPSLGNPRFRNRARLPRRRREESDRCQCGDGSRQLCEPGDSESARPTHHLRRPQPAFGRCCGLEPQNGGPSTLCREQGLRSIRRAHRGSHNPTSTGRPCMAAAVGHCLEQPAPALREDRDRWSRREQAPEGLAAHGR